MKGLLTKDFNLAVRTCWTYLLIIVPFLAASVTSDFGMFTMYPLVLISVIPLNLITIDEKCRWRNYASCMPYSRKEIVASKYILGAIMSAITIVIALAAQAVKLITRDGLNGEIPGQLAAMLAIYLFMSMVCPNIALPFMFKFDTEKSKIAYYIILGFAGGIVGMLTGLSSRSFNEIANALAEISVPKLLCISLLITLIFSFGSFAISVHAYNRRDL